jgi:hypothetical protein
MGSSKTTETAAAKATAAKKATAPKAEPKPKATKESKAVEEIVVSERGVGRVYREASGAYVVHARRAPGGFRTRRRYGKVTQARSAFKGFVAEYRTAEEAKAEKPSA